ncbi:MAG: DnaJ-class molecular chaperone, partial [Paracoccaceae bacterium]
MTADPYAALGLTKSASEADIKKAYRKVARTCHPDLKPDDAKAEEKFKAASAAYDLLKDPETRAKFDRGEVDASGVERRQQQYYRDYAEAPGNPYRSGEAHDGMSDIFSDFLRQQGREGASFRGRGHDARGADQRYMLNVTFMDAVRGGKTQISLPDGSTVAVKIPEGTADGQTIRLRGKGGQGYGNGPPGDALVTLTVMPHPVFQRDGDDILITLPITLDEAVLGGKIATPTISGTVNLSVPKGATSGQTMRLRGRGVKGNGDQMVTLSIVTPPKIDAALS